MLQNVIHLPVRGERPTRAGLFPRAEVSVCSATGNGSMGRNQGCFKRAVTMWSGRDSSLGSEWWRSERRTRPVAAGIVLSKDIAWWLQTGKPRGPWTCLSESGSKIAVDNDHGKSLRRPTWNSPGR